MDRHLLIITKRTHGGDIHVITLSAECTHCLDEYVGDFLMDENVIHVTRQRINSEGKILFAAGLK